MRGVMQRLHARLSSRRMRQDGLRSKSRTKMTTASAIPKSHFKNCHIAISRTFHADLMPSHNKQAYAGAVCVLSLAPSWRLTKTSLAITSRPPRKDSHAQDRISHPFPPPRTTRRAAPRRRSRDAHDFRLRRRCLHGRQLGRAGRDHGNAGHQVRHKCNDRHAGSPDV